MTQDEQLKSATEFARRVIQAMWDGVSDVDGGDIQIWAEELGLIYRRKATQEDCDEWSQFEVGEDMYEFDDWLKPGEQVERIGEQGRTA